MWHCICDCGRTVLAAGRALRTGARRSCGCLYAEDLTGRRFKRLTVSHRVENKGYKARWFCDCDCGGQVTVIAEHLKSGHTGSCGCLCDDTRARVRHGHSRIGRQTPEHRAWCNMKQRCFYENSRSFEYYGMRGITVCERWRDSFENFFADMGPRPSSKHSVDRWPDNDGDYAPGNARWATKAQQLANRRPYRPRKKWPARNQREPVMHATPFASQDG